MEVIYITQNIIDIRSFYQYQSGHIPGAKSIEKYELLKNPAKYLNKEKIYYIYCNSGIQSKVVVQKLNSIGYSTVNIDGGYYNYLLRN